MSHIPRFIKTRRGVIALAAVGAALLVEAGVVLAGASPLGQHRAVAVRLPAAEVVGHGSKKVHVGQAVAHFRTPVPLRDMKPAPFSWRADHEAARNPLLPGQARTVRDPVVQRKQGSGGRMPNPILNFDGTGFPGVNCNCAPPDTNGEVGATQYLQIVNQGIQVWNKADGAHLLGPIATGTLWSSGVCHAGYGDPVALYDQLANRWLVSEFAGSGVPTEECIAISDTSDATGTWHAWDFHLGTNFFDYPHLGVWPDGYYMSMNVFNSSGTAFLGPQAFAFDRVTMLTGAPATFVTLGITGGPSEPSFLPSDLDGIFLPAAGTGNPFVSFPAIGTGTYKVRLFHADFVTPANTTFNLIGSPAAAPFTALCPSTRACVPELGVPAALDEIGDRLMFRLAYRKFSDGHEAVVGNYTVSANSVAGVRWFELRAVTTAPAVFQES